MHGTYLQRDHYNAHLVREKVGVDSGKALVSNEEKLCASVYRENMEVKKGQ